MTGKQDRPLRVTLTAKPDGTLVATWKRRTIRFLLDDGRTVDVSTERDDSDLREALLVFTNAQKIAGVTDLPDAPALPL